MNSLDINWNWFYPIVDFDPRRVTNLLAKSWFVMIHVTLDSHLVCVGQWLAIQRLWFNLCWLTVCIVRAFWRNFVAIINNLLWHPSSSVDKVDLVRCLSGVKWIVNVLPLFLVGGAVLVYMQLNENEMGNFCCIKVSKQFVACHLQSEGIWWCLLCWAIEALLPIWSYFWAWPNKCTFVTRLPDRVKQLLQDGCWVLPSCWPEPKQY